MFDNQKTIHSFTDEITSPVTIRCVVLEENECVHVTCQEFKESESEEPCLKVVDIADVSTPIEYQIPFYASIGNL